MSRWFPGLRWRRRRRPTRSEPCRCRVYTICSFRCESCELRLPNCFGAQAEGWLLLYDTRPKQLGGREADARNLSVMCGTDVDPFGSINWRIRWRVRSETSRATTNSDAALLVRRDVQENVRARAARRWERASKGRKRKEPLRTRPGRTEKAKASAGPALMANPGQGIVKKIPSA